MKNIQKTHVIHNNETYHGHIFYPEENTTQHWKDIRFRDCSFRGDVTIGSMENCHFENCSFSGSVAARLQFLASEKIPEWCLSMPHVDKLKIYDPYMTSLPENIDKLEKLVELDVSGCSALRMLNGIETLRDLRSLNLKECTWIDVMWLEKAPQIVNLNLDNLHFSSPRLYELKNLQRLSLRNTICDFQILHNMKNLTHLDISGANFSGNINFLRGLENLKYLDCKSMSGIYSIDTLFFIFLVNLEYLDLSSTAIEEINFHLPNLKTLKLELCRHLRKIDISCEQLRHLTVRDSHNLDNFDFLDKLHSLRHLDAQYSKARKNHTLYLPETIESCNIVDCTSITQVKNTDKLPHLRELHIGCNLLDNFDFCQLSQLRSLRLSKVYLESEENVSRVLQNVDLECLDVDGRVSGIEHLAHLREIRLRCCTLDDFSFLPSGVKSVYLYHCHFINSDILKAWYNIDSLHIESGSTETYLRILSTFDKLKTLSIHGGTMTNLSTLQHNTSITTLKLKSCTNLRSLEALTKLKNLRDLSISFCYQSNLDSIVQLQNLRKLALCIYELDISVLKNLRYTDVYVTNEQGLLDLFGIWNYSNLM